MFTEYQEFIFDCQLRKLSPTTVKSYRNITKAFLVYIRDEYNLTDIEDIKKIHIQNYLRNKLEEGCKEKYVNSILKIIRAFYPYLIAEEYVQKNPVERIRFIKEERVIIDTFTDEEVMDLINAFDSIDYLSIRNKTIIALQLDTGIRCTETLNIKVNDMMGDRMLIHGKGKKQRIIGISPPMRKQLKVYMKSKMMFFHGKDNFDENLFLSRTGRGLTVEMIERIYRRAKDISKITREIRVSPHTSRHTFAVKMLATNDIYTVSKLLGHSNISITETYLRSLTNEKLIDRGLIRSPLQTIKSRKKSS